MDAMARESSTFDMPWSFRTRPRAFRVATADQKYLKALAWHNGIRKQRESKEKAKRKQRVSFSLCVDAARLKAV